MNELFRLVRFHDQTIKRKAVVELNHVEYAEDLKWVNQSRAVGVFSV